LNAAAADARAVAVPGEQDMSDTSLRLAVHGAAGRMGRRIVACAASDPRWRLVAAIEQRTCPHCGEDAGVLAGVAAAGVPVAARWEADADVVIDFSLPGAVGPIAQAAVERRVPLVVATTGLEPAEQQAVLDASRSVAVLQSPSMSLAVNVAMDLVGRAGRLLSAVAGRTDVEIIECHHRHKEDAPSGTALKFGAVVGEAMLHAHPRGPRQEVHGRSGRIGARPSGEIGFHAVRAGDNPGEHTILFGLDGESLAVNVRATSRDCYATGALAAAAYLVGKPAGLYSMRDVLGLDG
jgi:4-hydroxy-tetrahydrodipicolinate reductase